ncbi:MAG: squalene/phytoene synthase family protein, partial [Verrucomicrobiae bacterium]|nr:squalene/phytoene synthase family protein [Verrucomicrobiae bacterium]
KKINEWRNDLKKIYKGEEPTFEVNKELKQIIKKYNLPFSSFDELLNGVGMDLKIKRYNTFDELDLYCYRVASVVGLLSIEIFGYKNEKTKEFAVELGKALQLTNILRDVRNDALRGRIYIPLEELQRFSVPESDIMEGVHSHRFIKLARSIAEQAKNHFRKARQILPPEDKKSMIAAELMAEIYWNLLKKIEKCNYCVVGENKIRLGKSKKIMLGLKAIYWALVKSKIFPNSQYNPSYGTDM